MRKRLVILMLIVVAFISIQAENPQSNSQIKKMISENPILGHYLDVEELYSTTGDRAFYETDPPVGPIHNIAEFEPMEGVLIAYPFGIPYDLIVEMSQDAIVTTIVGSQSEQNSVTSSYTSYGVNLDNCRFLIATTDSYWTRDFGPWYIIDGNDEFGIVNFPYNRPRPNDDDVPIEVADFLDINLFGMDIEHTGGNYMTDGWGISASSDLVDYENPGLDEDDILDISNAYLGLTTYHIIDDPNNTYIDHIDCWGKLLDVDKVLIRSVSESHAQYDEIEAVAQYFEEQISSYGTPYQVFRVYTPNDQPYSNSLILNNKVFVPQTGSSWDDDALEVYQEAMPGYEIHGFTGSWESTDALHCRTKGMADLGMLLIRHLPVLGEQPADVETHITADIKAYSGEMLYSDSLLVYYKINDGDYTTTTLSITEGSTYQATLPAIADGDTLRYYLHAADASGRSMENPFIGRPDPHLYYAVQHPEIDTDVDMIQSELETNESYDSSFTISNIGGGNLEYNIRTIETTESRDVTGSYITCNAVDYEAGETVDWVFTAYNTSPDNEWVNDIIIDFPMGVTVNSATDFIGGSGGALANDGITGEGVQINWHGETSMGYGVLQDGEVATATINVTIDEDIVSNLLMNYQISGDGYGNDPHAVEGQIIVNGLGDPALWVNINPTTGNLDSGASDVINFTINSNDLTPGTYTCDILISGNAVNTLTIPVTLSVTGTDTEEDVVHYTTYLHDNYPNPFNPETTISFTTSGDYSTTLQIFNIKGQIVKTLVDNKLTAGFHSFKWSGDNDKGEKVTSGIYFYKLESGDQHQIKKMILMK